MSRKKLVLAYHTDNQSIAQKIDQEFSGQGYSFKHITNANGSIGSQVLESALPAIILVSDNFIKSTNCMEKALDWTQKMLKLDLLLPIVIDGQVKNLQTGKMESKETIFQRVSDVIKYMNYWQDQYLDLRKKRRTASAKEEPALSAQLQIVKEVSAEIGEYLRFLKNESPSSFQDFSKDGFATFFQFVKDDTTHKAYKLKNNISEEALVDTIEKPKVEEKKPIVEPAKTQVSEPAISANEPKVLSINDRYKKTTAKEDEPEIPVFVPATVPPKPAVAKINTPEEEEPEIPVFKPAVVPERPSNGVKKETETKADDIPVFVPATVPTSQSNGAKKEEEPTVEKEDDIPVFVRAVVPDRSKKREEPEEVAPVKAETTEDDNQSLVDIINASSKQILEENEQEEPEMPPVDLNTLPGMELLASTEENSTTIAPNLEDDFIKAIEDFGDIDESDMEFEEETVQNLEDFSSQMNHDDEKISTDQLNEIVDKVVEEEARMSPDLEENEEEDLADLINILEDNQEVETVVDAAIDDTPTSEIMDELLEETTVIEPLPANFTVETEDIKDQELAQLIAAVESNEETNDTDEIASETVETSTDESPTAATQEINPDLADIFEEEEDDQLFMETDGLISRAYQYFEEENWDGGLAVLEDGLENKPEDSDLRFQYALALAKHKNNFEKATRQLEILLGFNQQHEEAFFLLGELAELHKDYLMAKNYYDKVADINPDFPEIYYRLGIITNLHFDDQKESAANYLKKAIKKNKLNADAHYRLGILMNEYFENHLKAAKYFKKVLGVQPEHPFANYDLAILYHRLGDRALANIYYQKAVEINPELKTPANDEAFKYDLIGNMDETLIVSNEEGPEEDELTKDMARLEAKMANLAKEENAMKNQVLADLEKEFAGEDEVMEDLYAQEISENPIAKVVEPPKPPAKTILITGATSGIGRATAELFAENGYRIIMTGRRSERLDILKKDFENRFQSEVKTLPFDVRNVEEVQNAIDSLESEWREIDILLNNAGLAKGTGPIHEGDLHHWEQMIDTNIKGLLYMTRAIVPHMVKNREGHIINIASSAGKEVYPGGNVYCATKHAVDALTRAMRIDLHTHNVRVSQVAPGMVEETEFSLVRYDGDGEKAKIYEDFNPLTARDVAEVIYFVATRPKHVNVQDVLMFGTQQANSIYTNRDGRK